MHSSNRWGGTFEIHDAPSPAADDNQSTNAVDAADDRAALLREPQLGWLLGQRERKEEDKYVDLGIVLCKAKILKRMFYAVLIGLIVTGVPLIIVRSLPKHKVPVPPLDEYTVAVRQALNFFNAQKSGHLPQKHLVPWRGNSGLEDGSELPDAKGGLVGGYYDNGKNIKFHFPLAFSITLLSWSAIEYGHKYEAIKEHDHVKEIIRWGTDYLLRTFNSSAPSISRMYSQVGVARDNPSVPDDGFCWQSPEKMKYPRPVQTSTSAPDLGSEVAAALAAASLVFDHDAAYSDKLVKAAKTAFSFATKSRQQTPFSTGNLDIERFYNSSGYWDEFIWASAWLFYASGNSSYLAFATDETIYRNATGSLKNPDSRVFSWDNKLPGAQLLLSRLRIFLNPGFPYEYMLSEFHAKTSENMCSYFQQFHVFNWTKGGLIQLNHGQPQQLQFAANAAFLASLYAGYMRAGGIPGLHCGPHFFNSSTLDTFAASQVDYILGANPENMSYVVGYGDRYPGHVHHRGASIPSDGVGQSCTGGWKWRDAKSQNPNTIAGAMVAGPDRFDRFFDDRRNPNYTEPTLAGNAGIVAALVSLTGSSGAAGIDKNSMFSSVPPLYPNSPPPPSPWKP